MSASTSVRTLQRVIQSVATSDGAGVRLRRSIGRGAGMTLDPFLMLDEFSSENPDDYIAGFPAHPHRGFETVTYILDGHMRHEDHLGNQGDLKSGGVQWMTAGRGIIHSEMPQQEEGRMRGFQLWINLPAREKMKPAGYRDIQPEEIPMIEFAPGSRVKAIAGRFDDGHGRQADGPILGLATEPIYFDVQLAPGAVFEHPLPEGHQGFVYLYDGKADVGPAGNVRMLPASSAGILSDGSTLRVESGEQGSRFLLLAGRPLNEPVVQYGPFVMNTADEIRQAIHDYQSGRLVETPV